MKALAAAFAAVIACAASAAAEGRQLVWPDTEPDVSQAVVVRHA